MTSLPAVPTVLIPAINERSPRPRSVELTANSTSPVIVRPRRSSFHTINRSPARARQSFHPNRHGSPSLCLFCLKELARRRRMQRFELECEVLFRGARPAHGIFDFMSRVRPCSAQPTSTRSNRRTCFPKAAVRSSRFEAPFGDVRAFDVMLSIGDVRLPPFGRIDTWQNPLS